MKRINNKKNRNGGEGGNSRSSTNILYILFSKRFPNIICVDYNIYIYAQSVLL